MGDEIAINALIAHSFEEMELQKICAEVIDTVKSVALMEKLGMSRAGIQRQHTKDNEGKWRDVYWYGILKMSF